MGDLMHIQVPADLWPDLDAEGFDSLGSFRSPGQWADVAQGVITVTDQGLGLGANLVTVILARDALVSFAERVRIWAGRRSSEQLADDFEAELTVRSGGTESRITITRTGRAGTDAERTRQADTDALVKLLASAINGDKPDSGSQ
ncbi:hypothetical protein ACFYRI_09170 [Streptomyces microflavus]|uniref:hypothetical protein n=1 Tax=Streptomyces microflavus TaxID=1919 RepID=UPI00368D202F